MSETSGLDITTISTTSQPPEQASLSSVVATHASKEFTTPHPDLLSQGNTTQARSMSQSRENTEAEALYTGQALMQVRSLLAEATRFTNTPEQSLLTHQEQEALAFLQEHPQVLPEGVVLAQLSPEQARLVIQQTAFARLRYVAHEAIVQDTGRRGREHPEPTPLEMRMGTYAETLEPQIRDAVLEIYRKGYKTNNSGFNGEAFEKQILGGYFTLDRKTIVKLKTLGATVTLDQGVYTSIEFTPEIANLDQIRTTWNLIAALLPDKGHPAEPDNSMASALFRMIYSNNDLSIYPELEEFRQRPELYAYLAVAREFSPEAHDHAHTLALQLLNRLTVEKKKGLGTVSPEKAKDKKNILAFLGKFLGWRAK